MQVVDTRFVDSPDIPLIAGSAPVMGASLPPTVQDRFILALIVGTTQSEQAFRPNNEGRPMATGARECLVQAVHIKYLPANGTVTPDVLAQVTVQPDFTNLAPGILRAALTLAFDDGSVRTVSILAAVA